MPFLIVRSRIADVVFAYGLTKIECFYRNKGFDIERAKEVAEMLTGVHDFRTFMSVSRETRTVIGIKLNHFEFVRLIYVIFRQKHPFFARREMKSITIRPGRTIVTPDNYEKTVAEFEFWDFEFNAKTYIYRQVSRHLEISHSFYNISRYCFIFPK